MGFSPYWSKLELFSGCQVDPGVWTRPICQEASHGVWAWRMTIFVWSGLLGPHFSFCKRTIFILENIIFILGWKSCSILRRKATLPLQHAPLGVRGDSSRSTRGCWGLTAIKRNRQSKNMSGYWVLPTEQSPYLWLRVDLPTEGSLLCTAGDMFMFYLWNTPFKKPLI